MATLRDIQAAAGQPISFEELQRTNPEAAYYRQYGQLQSPASGMQVNPGVTTPASLSSARGEVAGLQGQDIGTQILERLREIQKYGTRQEGLGQREQISRVFQTPSDLIGASPQLQSSVRGAAVSAVQPTIGGARSLVQEAGNLIKDYQLYQQDKEEKAQSMIDAMVSAGSVALEEGMRVVPDLWKQAGTNIKAYEGILKGLKVKEQEELRRFNVQQSTSSATLKLLEDQRKQQEQQQKVFNEASDIINLTRNLLSSDLSGITGGIRLQGFIPGTKSREQKAFAQQLKDKLSLSEREKLKGSGTISDFEAKMLGNAATALTFDLSEEAFKRELAKIQGVFQTALGGVAAVMVTSPSGEIKTGTLSRDEINDAIGQGYKVEYIGQ